MNELMRQKVQDAFQEALGNEFSAFYRTWYKEQEITPTSSFPRTLQEWRTLPFLTKEKLVATPFLERLFVPWEKAHSIRTSSGTSGRGVVLIPRNFHVDRSYLKEKFTRILSFYYPHFGMDEACEPFKLGHIGAIQKMPEATARMSSLFKIDALAGPCSPILAFAPYLLKVYSGANIRYIHLWGEKPADVQFQEMATKFPNAEITWEYSNIESGGRSGYACAHLESLRDDRVHPYTDKFYWELIDPETSEVIEDLDRDGEIVLTTLWGGNAIPAIRYRTGDLARRVAKTCACVSEETVYQMLGRVAYDRAFIPGGEVKSEELERILAPFAAEIEGNFELHIFKKSDTKPQIVLYVHPRTRGLDLQGLARHLIRNMRIGTNRFLSDSINSSLISSVTCEPMPDHDKKVRRIVSHG
ncbi:MAG: hypothetical protein AAB421_05705 [Patescibacteria group bacterium]